MHVVLLTIDFSIRGSGGIGTYLHTLASGLVGRGHYVTVISPTIAERAGARYDVVVVPGTTSRQRRRLELAEIFRDAVLAVNARRRVDVVEATDYGLEGLACLQDPALAEAGIVTVVRLHTPDSLVCDLNGETRLSDSPAVRACEARYFQAAPHLSSPSRALARELERRWGVRADRVSVLPNPIDTTTLPCASSRAGRRPRHTRLTYFGRLERRKGPHVLAEALALVLPHDPSLEVEFIGADTRTLSGSCGRELRDLLAPWKERVRFAGFLSGDARIASLVASDVVCIPSLWENFPYTCLEALAVGCPVIATSGSGFEEILDDGVQGLLVPPGDPAALASAIAQVADGAFSPRPEQLADSVSAFDTRRLTPRFEEYYGGLAA